MRDRLRSLTSRLVLGAVLLALVVSTLLGVATTLAMRHALSERLDDDVRTTLARLVDRPPDAPADPGAEDRPPPIDLQNQAPGTLIAVLDEGRGGSGSAGVVVGGRRGEQDSLEGSVLERLGGLDGSSARGGGDVRSLDLRGLGTYRLASTTVGDSTLVVGLPADDVDEAVAQLVLVEVVLGLVAVLLAGGAAAAVVRRQLRPLNEVAATAHRVATLPLGSGDIELPDRVPDRLTDERTEVGQVGAALNTLLEHVESSLSARHRSEQQVRQFVADASHELRTPLTTIAGYAELAHRRPENAEAQRTALAKVTEESGRMTSLVEDLLLLARLDAGRPLERRPVDLTRLLLEAVSDARVVAPDHHWRLDLPDEAIEVDGDERRLHQVVTNLLTNARRHTPAGTTVTVRAERGGFAVLDDGPGFDPEVAGRAFDRFVRGDTSRTRDVQDAADGGAGLGLSLVHAIVTAHGGTVGLDSAPGSTTIEVRLPRDP